MPAVEHSPQGVGRGIEAGVHASCLLCRVAGARAAARNRRVGVPRRREEEAQRVGAAVVEGQPGAAEAGLALEQLGERGPGVSPLLLVRRDAVLIGHSLALSVEGEDQVAVPGESLREK